MSSVVPEVPQSLRPVAHYVKIANEYAQRDVVIYYWCLYHAVQEGMKLDKSSPPALNFLTSILSVLEQIKKENPRNEAITQDVVASAHIENHALKLFNYADSNDRNGTFNKNIVKAFYTSGHLFDVLTNFGELDENTQSARKYAKWKATYIHNCLKNGETPVPGPPGTDDVSAPAPSETGANPAAAGQAVDFGLPMPPSGASVNQFGMPAPHSSTGPFDPRSYPQQPPQPAPRSTSQVHPPQYPPAYPPMATPSSAPVLPTAQPPIPSGTGPAGNLTLEDFVEAKKYTKFALSALDYDDAKGAIDNMHKALAILQKTT